MGKQRKRPRWLYTTLLILLPLFSVFFISPLLRREFGQSRSILVGVAVLVLSILCLLASGSFSRRSRT